MTDLWILWEWPYDDAFVQRVVAGAHARGVTVSVFGRDAAGAALARLRDASRVPGVVLDRASDVLPEAQEVAILARRRGSVVLNDPDRTEAAADKARMHLALMSVGIEVPWTIVVPPRRAGADWDRDDLPCLGTPFVIKPARGFGGDGVVLDATCAADVERARDARPDESHLVQRFVHTARFGARPAYFRAIYCLGEVHPCLWDPRTRVYAEAAPGEVDPATLAGVAALAEAVARVAGMAVFSTEIAGAVDGRLVAVDYVNDMCDLRLCSATPDGIPDAVVDRVAARIAEVAAHVAEARGR